MATRTLVAVLVSLLAAACNSAPRATQQEPAVAPPPATADKPGDKPADPKVADKAADETKQKAEEKQQKQKDLKKELQKKQRELDYARIEQGTGELDRTVRTMTVEAALQRTAADLEQARAALDLFLTEQKPRELEDKKISLDRSTYYAEESKDELAELVAMYEADEFAKTTKELVLKRGRRQLEMADRSLAISRREHREFEQHTLPQRERDLRRKVADAELERRKAEIEAEKAKVELQVAERKAKERGADLEEEIADLQEKLQKLAKESP